MKNKICIVSDWLVTYAGAEKVIAEFFNIYPDADLFSIVDFLSDKDRESFKNKKSKTSFIQSLPLAKNKYKNYLPLMPFAIEQLNVTSYDIVLSSSHAVSKGVITGPDQLHISYVHSPIRYAWDLQFQYLEQSNLNKGIKSLLARYFLHKIRMWDVRTAYGVDHFVANSKFIARRIKKNYGRNADVIYPPVNVNKFILKFEKDNYYVTASRLVPYKRVDLIVSAFTRMHDKRLIVIGDGPEMEKIKKIATTNIEILGYQSDSNMNEYISKAKAFIFAAEEDFGISPVEAMATGTPVIAYGKGGVLESVIGDGDYKTGIFFNEQTEESIINAVNRFENQIDCFDPVICRDRAELFSISAFQENFKKYVDAKWLEFSEMKKVR